MNTQLQGGLSGHIRSCLKITLRWALSLITTKRAYVNAILTTFVSAPSSFPHYPKTSASEVRKLRCGLRRSHFSCDNADGSSLA